MMTCKSQLPFDVRLRRGKPSSKISDVAPYELTVQGTKSSKLVIYKEYRNFGSAFSSMADFPHHLQISKVPAIHSPSPEINSYLVFY
jgi:hypothetical protein